MEIKQRMIETVVQSISQYYTMQNACRVVRIKPSATYVENQQLAGRREEPLLLQNGTSTRRWATKLCV
jgi:hypothetical protein